jgi:hypothetical protein
VRRERRTLDEHAFQRHIHRHLWRYAGVVISLALLGGLLVSGLGLLAVQRGVLPPPTFTLAVGAVELSALSPSLEAFCPSSPPYYTIWITVQRTANDVDVYRLVSFMIDTSGSDCTCWCDR